MVDNKKTHTELFLRPMLGINEAYLSRFGYVNAYLKDIDHEPEYESAIYLLFRPADLQLFDKFIQAEKRRVGNLFLEDYDCGYGYVVLVYKIPDQYRGDYNLFLEGKYSKFSRELIEIFPETVPRKDEWGYEKLDHSLYFHIFNKSKAMKNYWEEKIGVELSSDAEYWSIPDTSTSRVSEETGKRGGKEVLDIKYIINKEEVHG
jgi:hypothetical protein